MYHVLNLSAFTGSIDLSPNSNLSKPQSYKDNGFISNWKYENQNENENTFKMKVLKIRIKI